MPRLIVMSPAPVLELAETDDLSDLSGLGVPIEIPDVVYWEAVRGELGSRLVAWANANQDVVRFAPTKAGVTYIQSLDVRRASELCEQAALETLRLSLEPHSAR